MSRLGKLSIGLSIMIALAQIIDIVIHVASNQAEPLRITSNIIILGWLAHLVSGKLVEWATRVTVAAIGAYLILSVLFLALEGIVNSESGELRMALIILVGLTTSLSTLMYSRYIGKVRGRASETLKQKRAVSGGVKLSRLAILRNKKATRAMQVANEFM